MANWSALQQIEDLAQKLGGEERIKRIQSGELVLVERNRQVVSVGGDNGGVSPYVSGLNTEAFIADWREFYRQVHGMNMDPSNLVKRLPRVTPGFNWGVWMPKDIRSQRAFEMCEAMFRCWKWTGNRSLDDVINLKKERRIATEQYIVWCRDRVEADEELKKVSALQIDERGIDTIMLTERLILEQWFYWKSDGKHLDIQNWMLCPASRYLGGSVPYVSWGGSDGDLSVDVCSSDCRGGSLRSRQAVS